jgi:hypothetical protein
MFGRVWTREETIGVTVTASGISLCSTNAWSASVVLRLLSVIQLLTLQFWSVTLLPLGSPPGKMQPPERSESTEPHSTRST